MTVIEKDYGSIVRMSDPDCPLVPFWLEQKTGEETVVHAFPEFRSLAREADRKREDLFSESSFRWILSRLSSFLTELSYVPGEEECGTVLYYVKKELSGFSPDAEAAFLCGSGGLSLGQKAPEKR
ncbi:MAG: hypothetical protein II797_05575, partial [Clostridia bacterium]|nr:hypothetical protein [Clostridia bacterium]